MSNEVRTKKMSEKRDVTAQERTGRWRLFPSLDITESADGLQVHLDMPGVAAEEVDLHCEDNVLSLSARTVDRQTGVRYVQREYRQGDFQRTLRLGKEVDVERISATYVNGVLTLHLPKVEALKARKIAVNA